MTIEERNQFIMEQLNSGVSLSDVQGLLSEAGIRMTYFELRMLAAELQIDWHKQDKAAPQPAEPPAAPEVSEGAEEDEFAEDGGAEEAMPADEPEAAGAADAVPGKVQIEVSKLVRPGAAISGTVVFPSGSKGEWYVDNMGRLGLNLDEGSSKPTQDDVIAFQQQLPKALGYEE